ncbi:hypothetical protein [Phenylobacterium sp.]|uniref:hypothetical protein n=1 Tax=Phenylobacterium sp. TaxID=1871053 RepID=UPI00272F26FB|nr:hypothetical protein [Phenylobacterium sp.]MDP1617482.1 hypothetical protein [Phenylobacterium sp.]MDP1986780.1 hypothetical protein [Phenylobacterium sp.]
MAIQGAMAAAQRRFDPYPQFDLALDFKGMALPGRPIFKHRGVISERVSDLPGWSYSRPGVDLIVPAAGGWDAFAQNEPPIVAGYGLESADGTTNKAIGRNAVMTPVAPLAADAFNSAAPDMACSGEAGALFSIEDFRADIAADPRLERLLRRGKINGYVLVIDNQSASNAWVRPAGQVGNTNVHAASVVCKVLVAGAVGLPNVGLNTVTTATHPGGAGWIWFGGAGVPPSTSSRIQLAVRPGGKAAFLLWQPEEKPYVTPPVIVDGALASRGAGLAALTNLGGLLAKPHTIVVRAKGPTANGVSRTLWQTDDGTTNAVSIRTARGSGDNLLTTNSAGANLTYIGAGVGMGELDIRLAVEVSETALRGNYNGGEERSAEDTTVLANLSRLSIASSGAGTSHLLGSVEFIGVMARGARDPERRTLAA